MPLVNSTTEEVMDILRKYKTIAVVGLSPDTSKTSHRVSKYMQDNGYKIIPVHPKADVILGEKVYASLHDIKEPYDIVNVFRRPQALPGIMKEAGDIENVKVIWLQLGLCHNESAKAATAKGKKIIQNKCILQEHRKVLSS